MIGARARLHLAAAVIPAGLAISVALLLSFGSSVELLSHVARLARFAGLAVLAAQLAVWLRWGALERRARNGRDGWPVGLGMAALAHALFGPLLALGLLGKAGPDDRPMALFEVAIIGSFFALASLVIAGVPSFLLTAWLAQRLAVRRRKELNLEPA